MERFPVKVADLAREFSRQVFPEAPITMVAGLDLQSGFDGMLLPNRQRPGEWGIIYNRAISSRGRINFTLAHELGHYLLHRQRLPAGVQCSSRAMHEWHSPLGAIEAEANTFASFLLMPLDDFRVQIQGEDVGMDLMRHLADRYEVSITAAILKWLSITDKRAMLVLGRDGFIDWARSSEPLLRSGIFYRARQQVTALPEASLAAAPAGYAGGEADILHPPGVWPGGEAVREMTIFSSRGETTVSLLLYPDDAPATRWGDEGEAEEWDLCDQLSAWGSD
jgi:hypothetical protein